MPVKGACTACAPIRLAHIIDSLRRDGTQVALVNLVRGLAEHGYEQRVYCLNAVVNDEILESLTARAAEVTVIGKAQLVNPVALFRLWAGLRRWQPHIVQTFLPFADTIGRTLAHLADVPITVSSIRARNIEKKPWQFALDRITCRWVDRVVFNSEQVIPFAMAHEAVRPEQVVYIPNGVDLTWRRQGAAVDRHRLQLGVSPQAPVIGTIGRLVEQKGHSHLLEAFAKVLENAPNTVLLVVGDGPLREELPARAMQLGIADRVWFLGQRADVPDLLACLDVYVQASLYEGMPNAVMEAMAVGKPVVATAVDGIAELITDGETGWLVEPADSRALAEGIAFALEHEMEARKVGLEAARRIGEDFSVERMVLAYDHLYRQLLVSVGAGEMVTGSPPTGPVRREGRRIEWQANP